MLKEFLAKYRIRLIQIVAVIALLSLVFIGVNLKPEKPKATINLETITQNSKVEEPDFSLNPGVPSRYVLFEDPRLPFSFQYPASWNLSVVFSKDRENYADKIVLVSNLSDFQITIDSIYDYNSNSQEAKDFVQTTPSNPYSLVTRKYLAEDFDTFKVQDKNLLISKKGGSKLLYNKDKNETRQQGSRLEFNRAEYVFELVSESEITDNLSIIRGQTTTEKANKLIVQYQVIGTAPTIAWVMYSGAIKQIIQSIEVSE